MYDIYNKKPKINFYIADKRLNSTQGRGICSLIIAEFIEIA